MSPVCWERRLAKRGLVLTIYESEVLLDWTVFVEPIDKSRNDNQFRPLIGIGVHSFRDEAVRLAVADFDEKEAELKREQTVRALAGESARTGW